MLSKRASCSRSSFTDDDSDFDENVFVKKKVSSSRKKSYKKWTKDEDERLKECINSNGSVINWSCVSQYVGNGRTDAQCQHRWDRFLDPSITKGPWTDEEDRRVIELVRDYGARQWSLIAKELKGRVGKQCRERWHNHLNPVINKNPWTNDENLLLFILHQHFGNKWAEIAKYFNGRSDNSIKNHWNSSMKKKFELEVANLNRQGLEWTALIPSDYPWPKFDKVASPRPALTTITNRSVAKRSSKEHTVSMVKTEAELPVMNSDSDHHHFFSTSEYGNMTVPSPHHLPTVYPEPLQPEARPNNQQENCSQDLERLFYCTPPSPVKQLPMLSSCADYTTSSQNSQPDPHISLFPAPLPYYSSQAPSQCSSISTFTVSSSPSSSQLTMHPPEARSLHETRRMFPSDESFPFTFNSQNDIKQDTEHLSIGFSSSQPVDVIVTSPKTVSNTSSPSRYRVLNTPERLDQPHRIHLTEHDWFSDYFSYPDQVTAAMPDTHASIRPTIVRRHKRLQKYQSTMLETKKREKFSRNLFTCSTKLKEELGYDPSYEEILIGQTDVQRHVTEQARRYLSCSSLNSFN